MATVINDIDNYHYISFPSWREICGWRAQLCDYVLIATELDKVNSSYRGEYIIAESPLPNPIQLDSSPSP